MDECVCVCKGERRGGGRAQGGGGEALTSVRT